MSLTNEEFSTSSVETQTQVLFTELKKDEPDLEVIAGWLRTNPECISFQDNEYRTPLHYLVSLADMNYELLQEILKITPRKSLSIYDSNLDTPLHLACRSDPLDKELISLLLKYGADPTLFDGCNATVFEYEGISENQDALKVLFDALDVQQQMRNSNVLPTLNELQNEYGRDSLAKNMHWALNAMNHVINTNVLMAANNLKGNQHTGGWSRKVRELMHEKFSSFIYASPHQFIESELVVKMAELLKDYRGGGDCFYQASSAYVYLLEHSVNNIEYYNMEGGSHHFVVIGRAPGSDPEKPKTWGPDAVICDPWAKYCFPASDFYKPREFECTQIGVPRPFGVDREKAIEILNNNKIIEWQEMLHQKKNRDPERGARALELQAALQQKIQQAQEKRMAAIANSNSQIKACIDSFENRINAIKMPMPAAHALLQALQSAFEQYKNEIGCHTPGQDKKIALAFKTSCKTAMTNIKSKELDQEPWVGDALNNVFKAIINSLNHLISSLNKLWKWDSSYTLFERKNYTSPELREALNEVSQIADKIPVPSGPRLHD